MKTGIIKQDHLWLRCPLCGDSARNLQKAHMAINLAKNVYYCVRCKEGGKLTTKQIFELGYNFSFLQNKQDLADYSIEDLIEYLLPGAGNRRFSMLDRYHAEIGSALYDVFILKDPWDSHPVGLHFRNSVKESLSFGELGLSWAGSGPLKSTESNPLRLVEGPYDVVNPRNVSVYGTISSANISWLKGHSVVLCPDGDIWDPSKGLLKPFIKLVYRLLRSDSPVYLVGIEKLLDNKDPDQVTNMGDVIKVRRKELHRYFVAKDSVRRKYAYA